MSGGGIQFKVALRVMFFRNRKRRTENRTAARTGKSRRIPAFGLGLVFAVAGFKG